jgi:hypothetical protein
MPPSRTSLSTFSGSSSRLSRQSSHACSTSQVSAVTLDDVPIETFGVFRMWLAHESQKVQDMKFNRKLERFPDWYKEEYKDDEGYALLTKDSFDPLKFDDAGNIVSRNNSHPLIPLRRSLRQHLTSPRYYQSARTVFLLHARSRRGQRYLSTDCIVVNRASEQTYRNPDSSLRSLGRWILSGRGTTREGIVRY